MLMMYTCCMATQQLRGTHAKYVRNNIQRRATCSDQRCTISGNDRIVARIELAVMKYSTLYLTLSAIRIGWANISFYCANRQCSLSKTAYTVKEPIKTESVRKRWQLGQSRSSEISTSTPDQPIRINQVTRDFGTVDLIRSTIFNHLTTHATRLNLLYALVECKISP